MTEPLKPTDASLIDAKIRAEIAKIETETTAIAHDAKTSRLMAESAELAHSKDVDRWRWEQAGDGHNRVLHFSDAVTPQHVAAAIDLLAHWDRLDNEDGAPQRSYEIQICSPGGSVIAGFKLYAYLTQLAKRRPLVTVATGYCASMATVIHQAGTDRLIEDGCSYLIHDPSGAAIGSLGDLEDTTEWMKMMKAQIHAILAERSNLTAAEIAEKSQRKDWWFMAEEAVELGFADRIR